MSSSGTHEPGMSNGTGEQASPASALTYPFEITPETGLTTADSVGIWEQVCAGTMAGKLASRVICTHMHPDHIGMAGWLTRRFDCRLWTTRLEYITCRMLVADTGREAPPDALRFYHAAGW